MRFASRGEGEKKSTSFSFFEIWARLAATSFFEITGPAGPRPLFLRNSPAADRDLFFFERPRPGLATTSFFGNGWLAPGSGHCLGHNGAAIARQND